MKVTIRDIANAVGVSHPTVSKALANHPGVNEETRRKILKAAEQMHYVPNVAAQRLAKRKSRSIGFIWNSFENLFLYHLCTRLQKKAKKRNIDFLITMDEPKKAIKNLYSHCIDYIFCWEAAVDEISDQIKDYQKNGCGFMFVGAKKPGADSLYINRYKSIYDTVSYLRNEGHEKIAFFGIETEKKRGYEAAMTDYGEDFSNLCVSVKGSYYEDFSLYERELTEGFLKMWNQENKPTAIILDSQNLAMGFLNVFGKLNIKIPEDISLITYDDIPEYSVYPVKLTTVSPSLDEIAEIVLNRFEAYYRGEDTGISLEIVPGITKRESVKNIKYTEGK